MKCLARSVALLLAALLSAPASAQTAQEQSQIAAAVERGRLLFELDRAAWVTTDDLREQIPDLDSSGIRGWIVEGDGDALIVTYFAGEGEARAAAYRGRVENRRVVSRQVFRQGERPPLTPYQQRLADARGAIARIDGRPCTEAPFNAVVIPPASADEGIEVYALTAQTEAGTFPFGGHFRATVSPAGEIVSQRPFTRGCFNAPMQAPAGGEPAGMFITHLLDPVPTEIHVFLSTWMGLPVYVGTGGRVWEVTADRIALVDQPAPKSGS